MPMDRVDVLRLLLRHTQGRSEDQRKGIKQILWEWPRPWSGTSWVSFNKYRRRTVRCRPTVHTWVKISSDTKIHQANPFLPDPFIFGPWTSTSYCNKSCGTKRFRLEIRTCTAISPNLPTNVSCQNQLTLRTGDMRCPPSSLNCTGQLSKENRNRLKRLQLTSLNATFPKGDVEQWSSWSDCAGNCSQGFKMITGERRRKRGRKINFESLIETQTQPCVPDCTSGKSKTFCPLFPNPPRNRVCKALGESGSRGGWSDL